MELWVRGNIAIRQMHFPYARSAPIEGHKHNFDHVTYVKRGGLRIEKLDDDGNVVQSVDKYATDDNNAVLILAGVRHRIWPLMDNSAGDCIYAHRTPQGDVVQEYTGWKEAYC